MKTVLLTCALCLAIMNVSLAQDLSYKKEAKNLYERIQDHFYMADSGYYRELAKGYQAEKPVSYLWPLCALVQADNEMEVAFPKEFYLAKTLAVIQKYYDPQPPAPGYASYSMEFKGEDRYYDDNQWIGIATLDAYARTKQKHYLQTGKLIYDFMMTGFDTAGGGGLYWVETKKETKNTCSNGPGVLVALGLYKATKNTNYLGTAKMIYDWTHRVLGSPNGLYYDNYNLKRRHIDSAFYSYNAGTMLESSVLLYQLTKNKMYLNNALRTAQSAESYFLGSGKFRDDYWFNAVLLRGYIKLYEVNKDPQYLQAFQRCVDYALANDRNKDGLFGKDKPVNLVNQGGMLEILARLAVLPSKVLQGSSNGVK